MRIAGASSAAAQTLPPQLPGGALTLEQMLEIAEARSEAVAIARAGISRADADRIRARSGLFPTLTLSAGYDRSLASEFEGIFNSTTSTPTCAPFTLNPQAPIDTRVAEMSARSTAAPWGRASSAAAAAPGPPTA